MILKSDYNALVFLGSWNKAIFNSQWVSRFLFPKEKKLSVEFPLNVDGSQRISTKKIRIFVIGNKLNFVPLDTEDETFELIQDLAIKTCDYLPHTPVSAFGVNFLFESKTRKANKFLKNFLKIGDADEILAFGAQINASNHRHSMEIDEKLLNLNVTYDNAKIIFDFNFNFKLSTLSEFKEKINKHSVLSLKDFALNFMEDVYNLRLQKRAK
jgi:hypothetical protein